MAITFRRCKEKERDHFEFWGVFAEGVLVGICYNRGQAATLAAQYRRNRREHTPALEPCWRRRLREQEGGAEG